MNVQKTGGLIITLLLVSFIGTGNANGKRTVADEIPKDTLITLERTACFGTCPVYKLTISADGKVAFEGKNTLEKSVPTQVRLRKHNWNNWFPNSGISI